MPKKLRTNPKALEARARKDSQKKEKKEQETKAAEAAYWADEGSTAKEKRKQEREAKKAEENTKRLQKKAALEKEEEILSKLVKTKPEKITRNTILSIAEREALVKEKDKELEKMKQQRLVPQIEPNENLNLQTAAYTAAERDKWGKNLLEAKDIDEAVSVIQQLHMNDSGDKDRHPEKRLKAAFLAYQEKHLPILKAENSTLKYSQLKELLWKNWQKTLINK